MLQYDDFMLLSGLQYCSQWQYCSRKAVAQGLAPTPVPELHPSPVKPISLHGQPIHKEGEGEGRSSLCLSNWLLLPITCWLCNTVAFCKVVLPDDARWKHYERRMQLRLGLPNSVGCNSNASTIQLTHSSQLKVKALHGTAPTDTHIAQSPGEDRQLTQPPLKKHWCRSSSSDKTYRRLRNTRLIRQSKLIELI